MMATVKTFKSCINQYLSIKVDGIQYAAHMMTLATTNTILDQLQNPGQQTLSSLI